MKRLFDVTVSGALLILCAPLLAAIAVAVRIDSEGPAIFRQERIGLHGMAFRIRKFRTMNVDSHGALVSPAGDPRITRIGAILRRTKLDELPQLLDVLQGRMSLVGPRPEVAQYVALWSNTDRVTILAVRPGLTDPASIAFRDESETLAASADPEAYYVNVLLPRKAAMYVQYVQNRTFLGDLKIVAETLRVVAGPTRRQRGSQ